MTMIEVDPVIAAARDFIADESAAMQAVGDAVDETFVRVARMLNDCRGKVIVSGVGTSGFIARRACHILSVSGTPAVFVHSADGMHGSFGAFQEGDILIVLSKGGGSSEVNTFAGLAKHKGIPVIALTSRGDSALADSADVAVVLPADDQSDPGGLIAMGSTLAHAAWLDAMAYVLMRVKSYGWDQVLFTHPGGAVGKIADLPEPLAPLAFSEEGTGH